jgi:hypothetical protein
VVTALKHYADPVSEVGRRAATDHHLASWLPPATRAGMALPSRHPSTAVDTRVKSIPASARAAARFI